MTTVTSPRTTNRLLVEAIIKSAQEKESEGRYEAAIDLYAEGLKDQPLSPELHYCRAVLYQKLDHFELALTGFNRTLELAPQFYEAYFRRATTKKRLAQLDGAMQDLDKVLASGGEKMRSKALFERAKILHLQKDYSAALNDYNLVAQAEPTNPEVFYQRGIMMDDVGQLDRAIDDFSKAIELRSTEDVFFYSRGYAHFRKGNNEQAIQDFTKAVALEPEQPDTYFWRGFAYERLKDYANAKTDFLKVVSNEPDGEAYFHLAYVLSKLAVTNEEHEESIHQFTRSISLLDANKPDYARAYFWRALEYEAVGEYTLALEDYTRAIDTMGTGNAFVPTILVNRGMAYKRLGEIGQALADLQKAADLMQLPLEELVKQFDVRLDDGALSPKKDVSRRKSVTFRLAAPAEAPRAVPKGPSPRPALKKSPSGVSSVTSGSTLASPSGKERAVGLGKKDHKKSTKKKEHKKEHKKESKKDKKKEHKKEKKKQHKKEKKKQHKKEKAAEPNGGSAPEKKEKKKHKKKSIDDGAKKTRRKEAHASDSHAKKIDAK